MKNEQKAPKDWSNWSDFANCYDLVLFNNCTNLVPADNTSDFEGVTYEWLEQHTQNCEAEHARARIEELESNNETDTKEYKDLVHEHGECPECSCEPYQWYAIAISEYDQKFLNENFNLDIFYSDILGLYILPVYHYGTSWSHVSLSMNKTASYD